MNTKNEDGTYDRRKWVVFLNMIDDDEEQNKFLQNFYHHENEMFVASLRESMFEDMTIGTMYDISAKYFQSPSVHDMMILRLNHRIKDLGTSILRTVGITINLSSLIDEYIESQPLEFWRDLYNESEGVLEQYYLEVLRSFLNMK
jgi:hypothetical protein